MVRGDSVIGFSIGEVSQSIGLAPQTLRLWEKERLIGPARTARGYRVYTELDVERLRKIKHLRKVEGLNFVAIRQQIGPVNGAPESANDSELSEATGERLRRLRLKAHKTLKEVSEATGLSISFISSLERGGSGASVASLRLLADTYRTNMRELFGADLDQSSPLVRRGDRPVMQWENNVQFEEVPPGRKRWPHPSSGFRQGPGAKASAPTAAKSSSTSSPAFCT